MTDQIPEEILLTFMAQIDRFSDTRSYIITFLIRKLRKRTFISLFESFSKENISQER